jgi:uncharacterized protein (DUF1697 family)
MQYAVFFRNLNLGRSQSPTRVQLEQAFLDAGALAAHSYLTNGTLVFTAKPRAIPATVLANAAKRLHTVCGLVETPTTPMASKRDDVEAIRFTVSEALSVSRKIGESPGSPNAFIEKHFALPATTRNWNTVVRLVQKYA